MQYGCITNVPKVPVLFLSHPRRVLPLALHERLLRQTKTQVSKYETGRPVIDSELNFARWMCFPTSCIPRLLSPGRQPPLHGITDKVVMSAFLPLGANVQGAVGGGHNNGNTCCNMVQSSTTPPQITTSKYLSNQHLPDTLLTGTDGGGFAGVPVIAFRLLHINRK